VSAENQDKKLFTSSFLILNNKLSFSKCTPAPDADFQVIPLFYKEFPKPRCFTFYVSMYKSKKWFKSLISKRTQLVRKNGGKKLEVALNAEKILIKKVQNVLKCQKKKLLRYHSKFFEHGSQCRVVFLPGALEVAQGVPGVTQGNPGYPGCTQGGPGCTSASSSALPFAPRRIICKTRNSANSYIQCKCNCRSSSLKSPTPQNSTQTSVESALLCVI